MSGSNCCFLTCIQVLCGQERWSGIPISLRIFLNQIPYDCTVEVRNRFKGLDLIDRVPEEIWMEVWDVVQKAVIKTIPKNKKCKNAKWLSEEALQLAGKEETLKAKEKRKGIRI